MTKFANFNTKKPDGVYVKFTKKITPDNTADPKDYLFQDPDYEEEDNKRLKAFENDEWCFVGVTAVAKINVIQNGVGTTYTLKSAGLWGIESDSGEDYFDEVFKEQCDDLKADILAFGTAKFPEE